MFLISLMISTLHHHQLKYIHNSMQYMLIMTMYMCFFQYKSCKTILVRNVGKKEANFKLETNKYVYTLLYTHYVHTILHTRPFSVSPSHSILPVNGCTQANVEFLPNNTGDYTGELTIHYDTGMTLQSCMHLLILIGEVVYVQLYGTAVDVNVRLDKSSILLESTYIGLCSQR